MEFCKAPQTVNKKTGRSASAKKADCTSVFSSSLNPLLFDLDHFMFDLMS